METTTTMNKNERRAMLRAAQGVAPPTTAADVLAPPTIAAEPNTFQRLVAISARVNDGIATITEINEMLTLTAELTKAAGKAAEDKAGALAGKVREALDAVLDEVIAAGFSSFSGSFIAAAPAVYEVKDESGKVIKPATEAKPGRIEFMFSTFTVAKSPGTAGNGASNGVKRILGLTAKESQAWWCRHHLGLSNKIGGQKLGTNASTFSVQAIAAENKIESGADAPVVSPF